MKVVKRILMDALKECRLVFVLRRDDELLSAIFLCRNPQCLMLLQSAPKAQVRLRKTSTQFSKLDLRASLLHVYFSPPLASIFT